MIWKFFCYIYGEYPYKIKSKVFKVPSGQKCTWKLKNGFKMPVLRGQGRKMGQNQPKSLFMHIKIRFFVLYHPINIGKCKKYLQTEPSKFVFPFFNLRVSQIKIKTFFYPREKNQWAQCRPDWAHSIFLGQTACQIQEMCEKSIR